MLTLIFGIRASEPPGPGELLKRPGLIGLNFVSNDATPTIFTKNNATAQKSRSIKTLNMGECKFIGPSSFGLSIQK